MSFNQIPDTIIEDLRERIDPLIEKVRALTLENGRLREALERLLGKGR